MDYQSTENSVFPLLEVTLRQNESIILERGAMVYHNSGIALTGEMNSNGSGGLGGMLKALGRSSTSGESFFISRATGTADNGCIAIAPATPGKIRELKIGAEQWRLNTGVFLASDTSVSYTMERQKLGKALLGGTGGLFVMATQGSGTLLVNSYGDIVELTLDGSEAMTIDNEHVIAWSTGLDYQIKVASGTFGFKTGEGLVNEFHGQGKVLIQTRNIHALAENILSFSSASSS